MSEKAKITLGTVASILVVIVSIIILCAFCYGFTPVIWFLAIFNLFSGPMCFILYLREVKKGVFSNHEDSGEETQG